MKHISIGLITACVFAQACSEFPAAADPDPGLHQSCGADQYQSLVGQRYALSILSQLPNPMRVIRPGQPVTMDYSAQRMNIDLDGSDIITRIYCG